MSFSAGTGHRSMAKVLWHITMSLDGFIGTSGNDMAWMLDYAGPNEAVDEVVPQIGAVLMGNRTFDGGTGEGKPYGSLWHGPMFVLTHRPPAEPVAGYKFVTGLTGSVESGLEAAKRAAGGKYVAILGADVARQCIAAGELDEILVHQVPVLLGGGVRLFERAGGAHVRLERRSLSSTPLVTNLWFRVVR
jgi:dihydrofolate reductase